MPKNLITSWRVTSCWSHTKIPASLRAYLLDSSSSTKWLKRISNNTLKVEILAQGQQTLTASEQILLRAKPRSRTLVREVNLHGNNQPWMFARSVFLNSSPKDKTTSLLSKLNDRPLGELLFKNPTLLRSEFELALVERENREYNFVKEILAPSLEPLWARRSIFFIYAKPAILLTEIFLPELVDCFHTLKCN